MATPEIFVKKRTGRSVRASATPSLFDAFEAEYTPVVEESAAPAEGGLASVAPVSAEAVIAPAPNAPTAVRELAADPAKVFRVGELVGEVRGVIEARYRRVTVEGEISNWRPAGSGHCYFTLKDEAAQLAVVMFRRSAALLRFRPKDGDAVRLRGQVSVYENRGQMQLIAETMELAGIGAQLVAVQELKARLRREGVFDRKRPLPEFPRCIGVVTSLQGAALRDIVKVCRRRHAAVNLLVYPAAVQGPNCAREVVAGLRWFSAHTERADVVIVARGGGSWEDLHGFDDEGVARAIAACAVPVITGIGHATDSVVADAAADVCAPTPSAAAELVTAAQHRVEERVADLARRLMRAERFELLHARQALANVNAEVALRSVAEGLGQRAQRVDELELRTGNAAARGLQHRSAHVQALDARLRRQHVSLRLAEESRRYAEFRDRLARVSRDVIDGRASRLESLRSRADAMNPLRVLDRGYALVYGADGKLLRHAGQVAAGEAIRARLAAGSVEATVTHTEE